MMTDTRSSVPIQHPRYNSAQITQGLSGLDHKLSSNEQALGISSAGPYPATSMNHANAFPPARYSSTMPVQYDDPPHLIAGPRGHQGIESQRQLDGHPTLGITQRIPFAVGPPRPEYDTPAISEVPNGDPASRVPHPYNVAGPFQENPSVVYSGVQVTELL